MAATQNSNGTHEKGGEYGLLANGSAGAWNVDVDEHIADGDRWWAQLEGATTYLRFQIPSLGVVSEIVSFLGGAGRSSERDATLRIGTYHGSPVALVRDDEYKDRCYVVIGTAANPAIRLTLAGPDVADIANAFRQVRDEIDEDKAAPE